MTPELVQEFRPRNNGDWEWRVMGAVMPPGGGRATVPFRVASGVERSERIARLQAAKAARKHVERQPAVDGWRP